MGWIIAGVIIIILVVRAVYELHHLKVTRYELHTEKLPAGCGVRFVFLSDLHLRSYGPHNEDLLALIAAQKPDFILLGGDMTQKKGHPDENGLYELLRNLSSIAKVYYAPGNHEAALKKGMDELVDKQLEDSLDFRLPEDFAFRYERLLKNCVKNDVSYLSNSHETVEWDREQAEATSGVVIVGLDLPYEYYDKKIKRKVCVEELADFLGPLNLENYQILLAHSPADFEEYVKYGADLVLAGHYHGGAIRFGKVGLVSPQVRFFPKYSAGRFEKNGTTMIVTRGAGSHSVNLRLFNFPEIVLIELGGSFASSEQADPTL